VAGPIELLEAIGRRLEELPERLAAILARGDGNRPAAESSPSAPGQQQSGQQQSPPGGWTYDLASEQQKQRPPLTLGAASQNLGFAMGGGFAEIAGGFARMQHLMKAFSEFGRSLQAAAGFGGEQQEVPGLSLEQARHLRDQRRAAEQEEKRRKTPPPVPLAIDLMPEGERVLTEEYKRKKKKRPPEVYDLLDEDERRQTPPTPYEMLPEGQPPRVIEPYELKGEKPTPKTAPTPYEMLPEGQQQEPSTIGARPPGAPAPRQMAEPYEMLPEGERPRPQAPPPYEMRAENRPPREPPQSRNLPFQQDPLTVNRPYSRPEPDTPLAHESKLTLKEIEKMMRDILERMDQMAAADTGDPSHSSDDLGPARELGTGVAEAVAGSGPPPASVRAQLGKPRHDAGSDNSPLDELVQKGIENFGGKIIKAAL
jgi:hypothetical protein